MVKKIAISVVIATKNEGKNITQILHSLKKQTFKNFEVIVVDGQSEDKTLTIAKELGAKTYILSKEKLKRAKNIRGAQVNFGVKKSIGKVIFIPDADMTFDKNILKEALLLSQKYDALYIPEVIIGDNLLGEIKTFERSFYNQTVIDAVRIIKKNIFEKVSGYDEKNIYFGPDDWDLNKRIKKVTPKISITQNHILHHREGQSLIDYLTKKSKYLPTFEKYIKKWGEDDPDIKKQFGLIYRFYGVFTENGKWKKIIRNPGMFIAVLVIKFLVGVEYLLFKISKKPNFSK